MRLASMANHEQKSLELLDEVDDLEKELRGEYVGQNRRDRIADLHQRINRSLKKADIHATHALRQAIQDLVVPA
jgi:hypothetical protein